MSHTLPRRAVPLSVPVLGGVNAGTGFFATYRGREWLVTAGHLPLMSPRPHARWNEWPSVIRIHMGNDSPTAFALVRQAGGMLDANFAYIGGGAEPLGDFMAMPMPLGAASRFDAHLFGLEGKEPRVGVNATIEGYPTDTTPWPRTPATRLSVTILGNTPEIVTYEPAAPGGTSGGPLVGLDENLIGMTIGLDDVGKAVPTFAIREILDANLAAGRF